MTMNDIIVRRVENKTEREALCVIWQGLFGDSLEYIEDFYKKFPAEENALVAILNGEVVGIVNSLECKAKTEKGLFYGRYIYALGVKENYRGRGIAKKLLEAGKGKDFTMLVPENAELFKMYGHLGYTQTVNVGKIFTEPHKLFDKAEYVLAAVKSQKEDMRDAEFFI